MTQDERTRLLQQIPVFAMRQLLYDHFPDPEDEAVLRDRFVAVIGRKPRSLRKALERLTGDELTRLINACLEIADDVVLDTFERYRYGSNPSFHIYVFDAARLNNLDHEQFRTSFSAALRDVGEITQAVEEAQPRIRDITLLDLIALPGSRDLHEGTYRFLNRIDYIDEQENVASVYETLYGFFWIGAGEGYVTIHARKPEVLRSVKYAIEEATGLQLMGLVMSKQFKNSLDFLEPGQMRSSRLHEPDQNSPRFRWLTIRDPQAYDKGYARYESSYPELRSTRYRVKIGERKTTLTIHLNRGSLSLAGRLKASEFRAWAIKSLHEVQRVLGEMRGIPGQYVIAAGLRQAPALAAYPSAQQKDLVLALYAELLALKEGGLESRQLMLQPLDLCLALGREFVVQLPLFCAEDEPEEALLACPMCDEINLAFFEQEEDLRLSCGRSRSHWQERLPFNPDIECEEDRLLIDEAYLASNLVLLPGARLLNTLSELFNNLTPGASYDSARETFLIRGSTLIYHPTSYLKLDVSDPRTRVHIEKIVQNVGQNVGSVAAVLYNA